MICVERPLYKTVSQLMMAYLREDKDHHIVFILIDRFHVVIVQGIFILHHHTGNEIRACLLLLLHQLLHGIIFYPVVGIDMHKKCSNCCCHSCVACCRQSSVMFMPDDPRLCLAIRIFFQHTFKDFDTLVGRTVVHEDDIEVMICLLEDGAGTPLDVFFHTVDRHEDADGVWFLGHIPVINYIRLRHL